MSMTASAPPRRRRTIVLLGGLIAILLWQSVFFSRGYPETTLASSYRLEASGGVLRWQQEFLDDPRPACQLLDLARAVVMGLANTAANAETVVASPDAGVSIAE